MASRSFSPILLRLFALLPALVAAAVPHLTNSLESYYDITPGGEFAIGWQSDSKPCEPTFWLVTGKGFAREREQLIDGRRQNWTDGVGALYWTAPSNENQINDVNCFRVRWSLRCGYSSSDGVILESQTEDSPNWVIAGNPANPYNKTTISRTATSATTTNTSITLSVPSAEIWTSSSESVTPNAATTAFTTTLGTAASIGSGSIPSATLNEQLPSESASYSGNRTPDIGAALKAAIAIGVIFAVLLFGGTIAFLYRRRRLCLAKRPPPAYPDIVYPPGYQEIGGSMIGELQSVERAQELCVKEHIEAIHVEEIPQDPVELSADTAMDLRAR